MNSEIKLHKLLTRKRLIQSLEEQQEKDKELWRKLGERVRSNAQKIYEMKEHLFRMIG